MNDPESGAGSGVIPPTRMDDFERGAALVLTRLYEEFPLPIEIIPSTIEPGANSALSMTHAATVSFLAREGYIRHGEVVPYYGKGATIPGRFSDATLTAKGLAALNATPKLLSGEAAAHGEDSAADPLGKRLVDAARAGGSTAAGTIIRTIIAEGTKWAMG